MPLAGDGTRRLAVAQSGAGAVWLVAPTAKQMTEDLFVSGDGGRSWSAPLPVPSSSHQTFARDGVAPDEVSVQLLSPEVGAVVLDQFWMGTDGTGTLDVSTDGGKTFTVDRLPTWGPVRFSSQSRGYLSATGRLYETTDGGADWRELEAPAPTSSSTASVKRITTVGFPIASSTGGMVVPVTVTTTTLASRTSETELLLMPLPAGGSGGAIGQPVGRPLSSDSELLVARGSGTGRLLVAQSDGSHVYSSTDTGETWASAVPTGLPAQWGLADVVLTTSGSAVALAVHQDCPGKQHCTSGAALYTTHDDGASWTLLDPLGDALAS